MSESNDKHNPENLIQFAEEAIKSHDKWWHILWWAHLTFAGLSAVAAVIVPFGLAALLYIKTDDLRIKFNIALIILSGISLLLQVLDHLLRLPDRSNLLRGFHQDLKVALAKFKDGAISTDVLIKVIDDVKERYKKDDRA